MIFPGVPSRPLNKWPFRKDQILVVIYNQQFRGPILLMVFDLQGLLLF